MCLSSHPTTASNKRMYPHQQQPRCTDNASATMAMDSPALSAAPSLVSILPENFSLAAAAAGCSQPSSHLQSQALQLPSAVLEALAHPSLQGAASVLLKAMEETGTLTRGLSLPAPTIADDEYFYDVTEVFDEEDAPTSVVRVQEPPAKRRRQEAPPPQQQPEPEQSLFELRMEAGLPACPLPMAPLGMTASPGGGGGGGAMSSSSASLVPGEGLGMMARLRAPPRIVASRLPPAHARSSIAAYGTLPISSQLGGGIPSESPLERLTSILQSRGYGTTPTPSMEYLQPDKKGSSKKQPSPSPLRLASYGTSVLRAAHTSDAASLRSLLASGISPNPCNAFHDDLLHIVCKNGDHGAFAALRDAGASWHVCDSLGRTPLHHCCWSDDMRRARSSNGQLGAMDIAAALIERDPTLLLLADHRGRTPLDFVASERWATWNAFLETNADRYWPRGGGGNNVAAPEDVAAMLPRDPAHAPSEDEATAVASGKADPAPLAESRLREMTQAQARQQPHGSDAEETTHRQQQYRHQRDHHQRGGKMVEATYAAARQQHLQAANSGADKSSERRTVAGRCA